MNVTSLSLTAMASIAIQKTIEFIWFTKAIRCLKITIQSSINSANKSECLKEEASPDSTMPKNSFAWESTFTSLMLEAKWEAVDERRRSLLSNFLIGISYLMEGFDIVGILNDHFNESTLKWFGFRWHFQDGHIVMGSKSKKNWMTSYNCNEFYVGYVLSPLYAYERKIGTEAT